MAVRVNRKSKSRRVLMPKAVHPAYRAVTRAIVRNQGIELVDVPYDRTTGRTDIAALAQFAGQDIAAMAIPQPNFFGVLEDIDALTDWAHRNNAIAIGVVNPTALAILKPPGQWGAKGADIACGDGQPLGAPLSSGGPYFGFMCCKQEHVRQMPGRIVGRTVDLDGKPGFALTLQAREQHIRRSKATSNICTNQGLLVTAATIYMSLLGVEGLERVAAQCHANTNALLDTLMAIPGVQRAFTAPVFHEAVVRLPKNTQAVLDALATQNILGGYNLRDDYPELGDAVLVCATEVHAAEDIGQFAASLRGALK
jgi:glycine dehydrogenase subunit 1